MNIIFLDIDGVLNSDRSTIAAMGKRPPMGADQALRTKSEIDPIAVSLINHICEHQKAYIVLSTYHRTLFIDGNSSGYVYCPTSNEVDLEALKDYMEVLGINKKYILDATPYMPGELRGDEIATWLLKNKFNPEHDNYVIIDDVDEMLPEQQKFFVLTNQSDGFTMKDYYNTCEVLRGGTVSRPARLADYE